MKVVSVSPNLCVRNRVNPHTIVKKSEVTNKLPIQQNFRGDTGAAFGVFGGAALGALTAAVIVATGGLAAPVAAIGLGGVMASGAAAGTHVGGIVGHIIEEKLG